MNSTGHSEVFSKSVLGLAVNAAPNFCMGQGEWLGAGFFSRTSMNSLSPLNWVWGSASKVWRRFSNDPHRALRGVL